jgi:hypothetical protein
MGRKALTKQLATSGQAFSGFGNIVGMLIGTDGVSDPTVVLFDGTSNAGVQKTPNADQPAAQEGYFGFMPGDLVIPCKDGCYCEITCAGTVDVIVYYDEGYK